MAFIPCDLRVDYCRGKITVSESKNPIFSWAAVSSKKNQKQSAYKIIATRDKDVIWDSGWVNTCKQQAVYDGLPLVNNDIITWSLNIKDKDGKISDSAENSFIVSYGSSFDANWISPSDYRQKDTHYFIKHFKINKRVKKAVLSACGLGLFKSYLNGFETDNAEFKPIFSNYAETAYYVVNIIDINRLSANNCLGIILADGWRNNTGKWSEDMLRNHPVPLFGKPVLSAKLDIYYEDGTSETVATDDSWTVIKGATSSHLFQGETYDGSKETIGWNSADFALSPYDRAVIVERPCKVTRPQTVECERVQRVYTPVSVIRHPNGGFVVDFGKNISGVCKVKIPKGTPRGAKIVLHHSEILNDDYTLYTENLRSATSIDCYISGEEIKKPRFWRPQFTIHGFRYVHITGIDFMESDTISALAIYTDVDKESSFVCSNSLVNEIQNAIILTEQNNIHGIFSDCPQRDERMGWMNDATARFEQVPYNFEISKLFPKVIEDCVAEQSDDGKITCTAPYFFGCIPADPICSAFIIAAYENLMHCGDLRTVERYYKNFKAWNEFIHSISKDGIVEYSIYGDWAGPAESCVSFEDPHSKVTPSSLMSTGFHYYNYKLLEKLASFLGEAQEERFNAKKAEAVREAFLAKWFDEETGIVATGSQGCQALSLRFGILPEHSRKKAARVMHKNVVENGYKITTGNITTQYLFDMLTEFGYTDTAWALMTREEYPSLGYMIRQGATTIWERYENKRNSAMNSHNHPMHGAVGGWLYRYISGIVPKQPGFESFLIKPHFPQNLDFAYANVDTPKGKIFSKWIKKENVIHFYADVPFGTTAEIHLKGEVKTVGSGFYHFSI